MAGVAQRSLPVAPTSTSVEEDACLVIVDVSAVVPHPEGPGEVDLELVGDLVAATGTTAQRTLMQHLSRAGRSLVIDVTRTTVDMRGQRVLAEVAEAARERGVTVDIRREPGRRGV